MVSKDKKILLVLSFFLLIILPFSFSNLENTSSVSFNANSLISHFNFTFVENDLIKINPIINDPDKDKTFIYYSAPLNESGEWQTDLGDSGIYYTKIIVSDGVYQTEKNLTLIIKNKNQFPIIKNKTITVKEGELINLSKLISDPDGDSLTISYSSPIGIDGVWSTTYLDS